MVCGVLLESKENVDVFELVIFVFKEFVLVYKMSNRVLC